MAIRIGLIANRNARSLRRQGYTPGRIALAVGTGCRVQATARPEEVPEALTTLLEGGLDVLCIHGGDGTQQQVLSELVRILGEAGPFPRIVVLRGGTMNMVANNLGTRLGVERELHLIERLYGALCEHRPLRDIPARLLRVDDATRDGARYGFVFANGVPYRILKAYYEAGPGGLAQAFNVTTSILATSFLGGGSRARYFSDVEGPVVVDGAAVEATPYKMAVAATIPGLVLWFRPFRGATRPARSGFYLLVNGMETGEIARNIVDLSRGRHAGPGFLCGPARDAAFVFSEGYAIDGEISPLARPTPIRVTEGPLLRFIDLRSVLPVRTALHPSWDAVVAA